MSQSSFSITNLSRTLFRTAVNTALQALASNNNGASAPSETYATMWWPDTTSGWVKMRNAANSDWEKKFPIAKARVDVASAATLDLDANAVTSDYLRITGTTTVTAVTLAAGQQRVALAGGAFQLTNSASLIVQGGADYTTTAGDLLLFIGESGVVVRVYVLQNSGAAYVALTGNQTIAGVKTFTSQPVLPQALTLATSQATTSGTAIDFTGIPSWAKRITISFYDVSTNGGNEYLIQIGSASFATSGYSSRSARVDTSAGTSSSTAGFILSTVNSAASVSGHAVITLVSGNSYACSHAATNGSQVIFGGGNVSLGGALDRIRITTVGATNTFDAGMVNILYE